MKITSINFTEDITSKYGLKAVKINRLNQVVLIAGKNGAGKTRFLDLLKEQVNLYPDSFKEQELKNNKASYLRSLESSVEFIKIQSPLLKNDKLSDDEVANIANGISGNEMSIKNLKKAIEAINSQLGTIPNISFSPSKEDKNLIEFVPKSLELKDSYTIASRELEQNARLIYNPGTNNISMGTIPAIDLIQKRHINVNTTLLDDLNATEDEINKINSDYSKLRKYIKIFLNTELKRNQDGHSEIFGKRIGEAKLSDGQKILLQFCLALYAQESNLENLIIFMDEPENHLHPGALIEILDRITPHVKNGQIWIATHSINVLAHFDPSNIWYIDKGEISYAGNVPHVVLEGLVGNDDEIEKLANFLSLPAQIASSKFAFESLFNPDVLLTGSEDDQVKQIHTIIKDRIKNNAKLKILDFGIGKGRLLSTIYENERMNGNNLIDWLDYYGYDINAVYKESCEKVFEEVYGDINNRYFNEAKAILTKHDPKTFDIVIMCNVFHEIDPKEWIGLFNSPTSIFSLLKDDGYLLIVEDQLLAVGEKAHSKGFLVFDSL